MSSYFQRNPTYQASPPGLARVTVWLWLTAVTGTRWMRDPSAPPTPLREKLWAAFGAWALFGLPALLVLWLALLVIWAFVRLGLAALALVLLVALGILTAARALGGHRPPAA